MAGVALFLWGGLSHTVLLVGAGFTPLPEEDAVVQALGGAIKEKGLYFFPRRDFHDHSPGQESAWREKFRRGPVGMIVYRPVGGEPFSSRKLLVQLLSDLAAGGIIAFVVSLLAAPYWERVLAVALLGVFACSTVSVIYWNWYEFPTSFFVAQVVDQAAGCLLAGLLAAKVLPPRRE